MSSENNTDNHTLYGYARVSTKGQSLKDQIDKLKKHNIDNKNIYSEKFTGTTTERPQFDKLMHIVKLGDEILVTKLDRFARNTQDALNWLSFLMKKGVKVHILNFGTVENTPIGRFMITTLSAVAELERSFIIERTQEGKEYARKHRKNYREGRPPRNKLSSIHGIPYDIIYGYYQNHSAKETAEKFRIGRATVFNIQKVFKDN